MYTRSGSGVKSTGTTAAIPNMSCARKERYDHQQRRRLFVGFTPYYTAAIGAGATITSH